MEHIDVSSASARRRKRSIEDDDENLYKEADDVTNVTDDVDTNKYKQMSIVGLLSRLMSCFIIGIILGIALEKARVFVPHHVRQQMLLKRYIMLKLFLSAVASGLLCLSLLAMLPQTRRKFQLASNSFSSCLHNKGLLSMCVGGILIGIGIVFAGASPEIVLAQVGAGAKNSGITLGGGLVGALLYGLLEAKLSRYFNTDATCNVTPLHEEFAAPYFIMSLPLVVMFAVSVFSMELLLPWAFDVKVPDNPPYNRFAHKAWPPYLCGLLIGVLQLPLVLLVQDTLGITSSYCTIVAQLLPGPARLLSPYLNKFKSDLKNRWQVFCVFGIVFGAYISASASGTWGTVKGVTPVHAFVGGVLMIFGSRLAGGCTSGHGLSGMGLLSILSFIAVAAMLTSGVITAHIMKYFDAFKLR